MAGLAVGLRISVVGCGWLGLPLAKALVSAGCQVKGSTTQPEKLPLLASEQISPFLYRLGDDPDTGLTALLEADILVLAIPPRAQNGLYENYLADLRDMLRQVAASAVSRVLFCSSTAVYSGLEGRVTEADAAPVGTRPAALLEAEEAVQALPAAVTVARLAGLFGPGRNPGRFLAGKTNVPNPHAPVNLLHLDDAVGSLLHLLTRKPESEVYNICAPLHPSRQAFYTAASRQVGLPAPTFAAALENSFTEVSSAKLIQRTGYQFRHPDPLLALPYITE